MRDGIGERELFGRDGELARIEASITGAGPGLRVVLLTGQAGIGKTALFQHLGALGLARTTRAETTRVGAGAPNPAVTAGGLTATEQQVVDLVTAGHTNRQTAERLFITTRPVEAHLTRLYAKLGVTSRTQLARHLSRPQ